MIVIFYSMDWKELISCTFEGPRFDDGGLDLGDLDSLIILRDLLVETARVIWHQDNPERERLSPGFLDDLRLRFLGLEKNCTTVRIRRPFEEPVGPLGTSYLKGMEPPPSPSDVSSKLEWAAAMIVEVVHGEDIPEDFPQRLLPEVKKFADSIRHGESIKLKLLAKPGERIRSIPATPQPT